MTIRVLVVDDSALVRKLLTEIIQSDPAFEVVGTAPNPIVARQLIKDLNPDVLTLDVEMPQMDGIDFLERLMRLRPMPVVMISSLTEKGNEITLRALELGAIDFITKPKVGISEGLHEYSIDIHNKLRAAASARVARRTPAVAKVASGPIKTVRLSSEKLVFVGASTGGTEAIRVFLQQMPSSAPAILITQHMPPGFTRSFADRLNSLCAMHVKEAEDHERVLPGHAYIAPGGRHMRIARSGANYLISLSDDAPVNRHRPSVDVLFDSATEHVARNAVGVILTGMGRDGAAGLLEMKNAGATTFAQDEASCVVFGMPKEAILLHAVDHVLPLSQMAEHVVALLAHGGRSLRI